MAVGVGGRKIGEDMLREITKWVEDRIAYL
jgi:hypothetical protein